MKRVIIAIIGFGLSGKDEVAKYIEKCHDFRRVDTGELNRDYIRENGLGEPSREIMTKTGNDLRRKFGNDYFAARALEYEGENLVVTGLRVPGEVDRIKEEDGFVIFVDAPVEVRYERGQKRLRVSDRISFEEFKRHEEIEAENKDPNKQNISRLKAVADITIENNGSLEELYEKTEKIFQQIIK
jgi:dephospho-CoA kinase